MLLTVVVSLVAGLIYIQTATPVYESTAKLYVQQNQQPLPGVTGTMPRYNLYTQAAVLNSTSTLSAALNVLPRDLRTIAGIGNPLGYLEHNIRVSVGKNDDTISVSLRSAYPVEASNIVNAVVNAFMDNYEGSKQETLKDLLEGLQRRMDEFDRKLQTKRREMATLKKDSALLAMELEQEGAIAEETRALSAERLRMRLAKIEAAASYGALKKVSADPAALREYIRSTAGVPQESPASRQATLRDRLFELELARDALLHGNLTVDHPRVFALAHEANEVKAELARLDADFVAALLAAAEQRCLDLETKEAQISALLAESMQRATQLNERMADYQVLQSETAELTRNRDMVAQQIEQTDWRTETSVDPLRIGILEVARPASYPCEPQKRRILAGTLIFGLLLGGGLAMARDWLDQTLRSADEISTTLGVSVLGVVPAMSQRETVPMRGQRVHLQPDSHEAEAYRTLRTAILFGAAKERAKTLLVTSPAPGDGKSTLVSNLAIAMAQAGHKTLVLDADLRKPTQHRLFGLTPERPDIGDVLAGKARLSEAIQPSPVPGLSLLACKGGVANPAEVLQGRRFARLLLLLTQVYDRIIIDASPVMVVTDAQIIAALSDWTILVLRAEKSTRKVSRRAIDSLQGVGARLLGVVVNGVRKGGAHYGYYGTYGDYYGSDRNRRGTLSAQEAHAGPNGKRLSRMLVAGGQKSSREAAP